MYDLKKRRAYIQNLMMKLNFPSDAPKTFVEAFDCISNDIEASARFSCILQQYDNSENCSYVQMLADVKAIGEDLGIHEYTISLLLFICMSEKLHCRYSTRGINDRIYFNSLMDLRYKLEECRLVYGVNGSFVASWFSGFFDLTRFALGRLQFEVVETGEAYTVGGLTLPVGSKAINIHIPRTGTKLDHQEVLDSYQLAAAFFAEEFQHQPMAFTCASWLLDPWNLSVLPPSSNLALFYKDFKIVETQGYDGYGEMWRLFDCLCTEDTSSLPKDSSLRRAYVDRIDRGEPVAWGRGLFIYRDGALINE